MIGEPALSLPVGRVGGSSDDVGRRVGLDIAVEIKLVERRMKELKCALCEPN